MKTLLHFALAMICCLAVGQSPQEVCQEVYYTTGELSTRICQPSHGKAGEAVAYSRKGEKIYQGEIRHQGIYSQVSFTYYEDGALKRAKASWQPDGGIQSGGSITEFDRQGNITLERELNLPRRPADLQAPSLPAKHIDVPLRGPKVVAGPPTRESKLYAINRFRRPLTIRFTDSEGRNLTSDLKEEVQAQPGDTIYVGYLQSQGAFPNPCERVEMEVVAKRKRWLKKIQKDCMYSERDMPNPAVRLYYFRIRPR